ncbi:hypothetical protein [Herbiconiux sp.]|nr:hypothetical protein [Herbiconiux sp.]
MIWVLAVVAILAAGLTLPTTLAVIVCAAVIVTACIVHHIIRQIPPL